MSPSDKAATSDTDALLLETLANVAPGTLLRDGLERVLRGRTGGLIVLGYDKEVEALCSGGFELDIEFSATRLRELAKMDGAIILDGDGAQIHRAAVHLMPDPSIVSEEMGTRHRTAERVAKQTGHPVISVSQSMNIIALYVAGRRYVLEDSAAILSRANQALATLERYKLRLDEVSGTLSALEIEDLVTVRDVASVAQRLEMVRRIAIEIDGYVVELGSDGRLLSLQLTELIGGVEYDREMVIRDYLPSGGRRARTLEQRGNRAGRPHRRRAARPAVGGARLWVTPETPMCWTPTSARAATAYSRGCRDCRTPSSTGSSTSSAGSRSYLRPASTTCRPSTASEKPAPAPFEKGCLGLRSRAFWSATSNRALTGSTASNAEVQAANTRTATRSTGERSWGDATPR